MDEGMIPGPRYYDRIDQSGGTDVEQASSKKSQV
jgi:hypothetical protein